ncbi:MAG TPA: glutamine amidotransferase [Vicinamibacterales bacterium]|nr:glutamine amidotransferase [Vicinamibacterales bacterium]
MFNSLFEFFFKYSPYVFQQGEFRLAASSPTFVAVALAAVIALATVLTYRTAPGDASVLDRAVLITLRLCLVVLVLFCLFRPVLILRAAVPQQNFLGILLDDSRSMRVADQDGKARGEFVNEAFNPDSPIMKALSSRYAVRIFRFASSTDRIAASRDLSFDGTQTKLGDALQRSKEEFAGLPLAGLVVVTDGADTEASSIQESLLELRASQIPVFTVGVGKEALGRDIQVSRVSAPRKVLKGTNLSVDVIVSQNGFRGTTVPLNVEDSGRIISSQQVPLTNDGEPTTVKVHFTANEAGARTIRFRIPNQDGEEIAQNNVRDVLLDVQDRKEKILFFDGEPHFEVKFIRRAVADDPNLQLVVLQRTTATKFFRILIDSGDELAAGFPKTRDELFSYRGLILGSIEANAFTGDQLRMIADFADRRGGGLMMIGGRRAFAEGGYAGTPVADALPVVLGSKQSDTTTRVQVSPTRAGQSHAVTQIEKTEQESVKRWSELPQVITVNPIRQIKSGATALLRGVDDNGRESIVLAYQRYGRGKSLAFPIYDSWTWQMDAKIPVEDMTHETFWRQVMRWMVDGVPDQLELTSSPDQVEPGETVTLIAEVADSSFLEVNDAGVSAHVTGPKGAAFDVPLQWTGERNGEYRGTFTPGEIGMYEARVDASRAGASLGRNVGHVRVASSDSEYFDAAMRAPLLRRISEETSGVHYTPANLSSLPDDVKYAGRGVTTVEERDLWDMPIVLFLLLTVMLAEWSYRRVRHLA